ncbi:unnamed protein product [Paramecium primaurelia]|uniref:Uncharacterized protein n=1 Tax=Paramecium primaurelia TaxID=5886 RepID=A0A8S1Q8D3_PARPR|nr:unnamed protein product [Paramecium primaurelia]
MIISYLILLKNAKRFNYFYRFLKKKLIDSSFSADDEFCQELLTRFAGIKPPYLSEHELWEKDKKQKEYELVEFIILIMNKEEDEKAKKELHKKLQTKKPLDGQLEELYKKIELEKAKEESRMKCLKERELKQLKLQYLINKN